MRAKSCTKWLVAAPIIAAIVSAGVIYLFSPASHHVRAYASILLQEVMITLLPGEKSSVPRVIVHDKFASNPQGVATLQVLFDENGGKDITETIADSEHTVFWRHLKAWDASIRLLANNYDNAESIRLAVRPYGGWWMQDYVWLIRHLRALGYEFRSYNEYDGRELTGEKIVYLRFDVHLRDLAPLYVMLDANMALDVPSVSFLMWDYSKRELDRRQDFLNIRKFKHPLNSFALHASPVPTYVEAWLRESSPDAELIPWLKADGLQGLLDAIRAGDRSYPDVDTIREGARQAFAATAAAFREEFPEARLVSYHGSGFDRRLRRLCREDSVYCDFKSLTVFGMAEPMRYVAKRNDWVIVDQAPIVTATDSASEISMLCVIERQAMKGDGLALLVHPAQMFRSRRHYSEVGIAPGGSLGEQCGKTTPDIHESDEE